MQGWGAMRRGATYPQRAPQFLKGRLFRETEHAEGIGVECLTFQRAGDKSGGKALADACGLCQIEVAAGSLGNGAQAREFHLIGAPELILRQAPRIMHAAEDYQRTDLESPRQADRLFIQVGAPVILLGHSCERVQQFGRNLIAPALHMLGGHGSGLTESWSSTRSTMAACSGSEASGNANIASLDPFTFAWPTIWVTTVFIHLRPPPPLIAKETISGDTPFSILTRIK